MFLLIPLKSMILADQIDEDGDWLNLINFELFEEGI